MPNGQAVGDVDNFTYLGTKMSNSSNEEEEIGARLSKSVAKTKGAEKQRKTKMNKLLWLCILACLLFQASSVPVSESAVTRERRSPCSSGGCSFMKKVKFQSRRRPGRPRRPGRRRPYRLRSSREWGLPDDDFTDITGYKEQQKSIDN
ncbi:hypothetical protein AWC38_SpisGene2118 [Stylophora pistillata]|uniref:Uncharacterized protein n=1 Tax=Stylophora pistillata TaxID=50429 RepID=A0A2B4SV09_STYPI|nr:hypothetical protein AWC38_SpisGene2118 [Stylophora pistillata]